MFFVEIGNPNANTFNFIDWFLHPDKTWKENIKTLEKIKIMKDILRYAHPEVIADYIRGMGYYDFLETPYWKAISERVKKKHRYTCEMCSANGCELHTHHPNYSIHGFELQKMSKLKCLCSDCHEKFHND